MKFFYKHYSQTNDISMGAKMGHTYYLVVKYKKEKKLFPAELTEFYS